MKKMFFVMNPYSGTRKGSAALPEIISVFNRAGYDVTTYMTAGVGDAVGAVERHAGNVDLVVCAGGDGTFNETVTGLMRAGVQTPVGYIPCGSTNDFASSMNLSLDPVQAAEDIVNGTMTVLDVGRFQERYFTYVASFGAFTRTSYTTPQNLKNALGHLAYVLQGITEIPQIHKVHVRVETEKEMVEDDFIFGAISNSTSVAGILTLDPKMVNMSDGVFELMLVRAPVDILELGECIQCLQRQQYNCDMITFTTAKSFTVTTDPGLVWTLDGERADGSHEIKVEAIHHAINMVRKV